MPKYGMNFEFKGYVIPGRELKSKTSDWKATLFKFNAMSDIFEVAVEDEVAIENLKKLGDKPALVKGVIERQGDKMRLVPSSIEAMKPTA
jgi:hypothetical protein